MTHIPHKKNHNKQKNNLNTKKAINFFLNCLSIPTKELHFNWNSMHFDLNKPKSRKITNCSHKSNSGFIKKTSSSLIKVSFKIEFRFLKVVKPNQTPNL